MARELNQNLAAFLQSGAGSNFASWCEIILPELPGSPVANQLGRVYRFATTGCKGGNLVIDSAQYEPYLKTLGEIKRTTTTQTETATITLINTNNELGNVLLKDTDVLHGATVRCGRWWEDPKTATQYSYQQFKGVVDGIEANQDAITLTLISDLYAARTIGGGRKIDRACQFVFNSPAVRLAGTEKGAQCAYTGTLTTCNKLYDDADGCSGRSNQAHYGGFVKLAGKNPVSGATAEAPNYQRVVNSGGTTLKMQPALKFTGATITNDNTNKLTEIDLTGSGNLDYYFVDADPYNAVGDGSTDDTAAIQAAIDAAEATKGTVYFGRKVYKTTGLTVDGKTRLLGASEGGTVIYSTSNAVIVDMTADADFLGGTIENITIRGSVSAGSSQIGLKLDDGTYGYRFEVRNVQIENCGDHGLYIGKAFSSRFENVFITNCADHPLLYDANNMPGNVFHSVYAGNLRSTGTTAFRIKAGEFIGFNCNGINSVPTGAKWMVVGKKNGVDGDATDSGATVRLTDCNIESFDTHGILAYHSSLIDVRGRSVFAGNGNSNQIGIEFDLAGDGSSYYAQFITRGTIDDTVNFADGLSAYKNSQPIHANGFAPIQICGAGPSTGGGVPLSTYRNATAGATSKLANASGYSSIQTVTATTTIAQPGVKLIEVNNTSGGPITITIPWGGWYQSAQDVLIIKDVGGNAATHTITIAVGGGIGTLTTMTINGQALVLTPDGNTGSGTWRVISNYSPGGTTSSIPTGVYNVVTDYGAAGDGSTNDTTAIQNAINAANTAGGGTVWLPRGEYLVTNLRLKSRVILEGAGMGSSVITTATTTSAVLEANATTCNFAQVRNLTIVGAGSGSNNHGVYTTGVTDETYMFRMEHVEVKDCGGKGIFIDAMFSCSFDDVFVTNCGDNLFDLKGGNTIALYNCYADDVAANKTGYRIHRGQVTMVNCNGIDSLGTGTSWAVFGDKTSEDGVDAYVDAILIGCNVEEFKLYGVRAKEGSRAEYYTTFFTASSSGSAHVAILHDYTADNPGILASSCRFNTNGGTWANSLPIHSGNDMPVLCLGHNNQTQYYYDGGATAVTLLGVDVASLGGTKYVNLVRGAMNELAFNTDNSGDIGPSETYRPRDVNAGRYVRAGSYLINVDGVISNFFSNSASAAAIWSLRRGRGTSGSPTAVQSGDVLGYIEAAGQYSTTDGQRHASAYITASATENFGGSAAGTKIVISVAPNGSTDGFNKKWEFDGDNGLKRPGGAYIGDLQAARVYRSSTQSVNNISWTAITFDSETRDDGGFHSTSSNTDRMTAPATGWYQISANIEFVASSTGSRMARFYLNGTTEIARAALASIATYSTFVPLTATYYLTASDYVTCDVFQDSGGSLNVGTSSFYQIHRVY